MTSSCENKEKKAAALSEARAQEIEAGREESLRHFTALQSWLQKKQ